MSGNINYEYMHLWREQKIAANQIMNVELEAGHAFYTYMAGLAPGAAIYTWACASEKYWGAKLKPSSSCGIGNDIGYLHESSKSFSSVSRSTFA
jgi:hypothetical protein